MVELQFNYPILPEQEQAFAELLREVAKDGGELVRLTPRGDRDHYRKAAAKFLSLAGSEIDHKRVLLGTGGHNGMLLALIHARVWGQKIAADALTYSGLKAQSGALVFEMLPCAGDADGMLPESLERAVAAGARVVYLMPTVHNPLGTVMPIKRRREIADIAKKRDLLIIDDDAYGFMDGNAPSTFAELAPEHSVYIKSFTKPFAPALKVSWIVVPERHAWQMSQLQKEMGSQASPVLADVALRAMQNGVMERIIRAKRNDAARLQKVARAALEGLNVQGHPTSYHLWLKLPEGVKANDLEERLNEKQISVLPARHLAADETLNESGMRISFGCSRDENILREALGTVAEEVRRA